MRKIHYLLLAIAPIVMPLGACWRDSTSSRAASTAPRTAAAPAPAPVAIAPPRIELTPDLLLSTIRSTYLAGLERCYSRTLKKNSGVRGTVTVTMTIDGSGRLSSRRAEGVGPTVESCVEDAMLRWVFPPATTADGRPSEQSFRLSLQLRPI